MTVNLHVTLAESHPVTPMESYLLGVPCLISPTSDLFADDPELRGLTTVDSIDDPVAIATAARRLLDSTATAVSRAHEALQRADAHAAAAWREFTATA